MTPTEEGGPRLAIIVPAFNEERGLARTLRKIRLSVDSALVSRDYPIELLVVDDGSTDSTRQVATTLADGVVVGFRRGIGAARNEGARATTASWLMFIDADTSIEAGVVDAVVDSFERGARVGAVNPHYSSGRPAIKLLLAVWRWYAPRHEMTQGVCQFIDRALFEELGGYRTDLRMAEDTDLYHRAVSITRARGERSEVITSVAVHPSMRRYEERPAWWLLAMTNPISTKLFRRSRRVWRDWYVNPPR